jgi:hypothetical protein
LDIEKIVLFVVGLVVAGVLLPVGIVAISNTTALSAGGVSATNIALYSVIGVIAIVAFIIIIIKSVM